MKKILLEALIAIFFLFVSSQAFADKQDKSDDPSLWEKVKTESREIGSEVSEKFTQQKEKASDNIKETYDGVRDKVKETSKKVKSSSDKEPRELKKPK